MNYFFPALTILLLILVASCIKPKYTGVPEDVKLNWMLDRYGENIAKKDNMEFLFVGTSTRKQHSRICINFSKKPQETLNEARIFAANFAEDYINTLRNSPEMKFYISETRKYNPSYPKEVEAKRDVGFKIGYWDDNIDRPLHPFIAEIMFEGNVFYYYEAEPKTQKLKLIYEEPYDKAIEYRNSMKNNSKAVTVKQ